MVTWDELEAVHPLAERARREWGEMPVAHLATVRRDGSPRMHPVCPQITHGRLFVVVTSASPKRHDLQNDGRFALHTIESGEPGPDFDEFEFNVEGRARRIPLEDAATWAAVRDVYPYPIPDDDRLFELDIERSLSATWDPLGTPGRRAHRLAWRVGWDAARQPSNEGS